MTGAGGAEGLTALGPALAGALGGEVEVASISAATLPEIVAALGPLLLL